MIKTSDSIITEELIKEELDKYNSLKSIIKKIISPIDMNSLEPKEKKEVFHCAKFLSHINYSDYTISKSERPDIIVRKRKSIIGIEHTIITNNDKKKISGTIENIIKGAQEMFIKKYPENKVLVDINIYLNIPEYLNKFP